jgi:chondroitin AC lyase
MVYCSYGAGYRLSGDTSYKHILVQAAKSLCTRFNATTGTIKSWNEFKSWTDSTRYYYPVIIDNMMNLELLFFASEVSGDPFYKNIAVTHADATLKNHFRKDFSAYHVVCYDSTNGKVLAKESAQGYAHESAWARGQAWALYGFTTTYRWTKEKRYLNQAISIANYLMHHPNLPEDKVPYWDYDAGKPGFTPCGPNAAKYASGEQPRDASAAAIIASALLELCDYVPAKESKAMIAFASDIVNSLSSPDFLAAENTNGSFLLKHSVGSIPHGGEIDVPLIYADYYFLEALLRLKMKG